MGMSASQARLIQLTARMSDLELEGQQINQQRLNLANQSSAIQEQALKMPVPTAPSTYEYMKDVYTGTDSDGNKVKAGSPDADGNMPVSTLSKDPIDSMEAGTASASVAPETKAIQAPAAENSITAKFKKEVEVHCWKGGPESKQITDKEYSDKKDDVATKLNDLKGKNNNKESEPVESDFQVDDTTSYNNAHSAWENSTATDKGPEPQQSEYQMTDKTAFIEAKEAYKTYTDAKADLDTYKEDKYYELEENATGEATSAKGGKVDANYKHAHSINAQGEPEAIKYTFTDAFEKEQTDKSAEDLQKASSGYSAAQIKSMVNKEPQLFVDEKGETKLGTQHFDEATGKLKDGIKLYENVEKYEKIGGDRAYDLGEANNTSNWKNGKTDQENVDKLIQAIKNYEANANNGIPSSEELAKWRITQNTDGKINAFKMDADGKNAQEYTLQEKQKAGWNTQTINAKTAGFDENGVSNVPLGNGKTAYLQKSQELDTTAYQAAEADYKNQKAAYDHAQEEANTKVKKLQQIDKQLELKLKRLDTERNALNTEIDAVKKVIQDNTDKSFKTFSG